MRYLFEEYTFDADRRELHRGTDALSITPQVFDLLDYLIRNRERVVSKDDLIKAIWNGRSVSDAALTTRLNAARGAIGDSGEEQRFIRTLPRKGFRFVGQVREVGRPNPGDAPKTAPAVTDKPSIAVLPFANMSGDPEQEYFADGMVEEITTALSRFNSLFVIARNSSFTFKGMPVDIKEVGRRLGVRYVLQGAVRKASGKVRITGQLIEAATGANIWADKFERDMTDIFALQDEVTLAVVSAIQPKLFQTEISLARGGDRKTSPRMIFFSGLYSKRFNRPAKVWPRHSDWSSAPWSLTLGLLPRPLWRVIVIWKTCLGATRSTHNSNARKLSGSCAWH